MTTTTIKCFKCQGRGFIRAFTHVNNGECFECGGSGELDATDVVHAPVSCSPVSDLEALRSVYRACASRTGADRSDWLDLVAEPFDAYSPLSPLAIVRTRLARVAAVDAAKASQVRASFALLGLAL